MSSQMSVSNTVRSHIVRFGVFEADLDACELRKQTRLVKLQVQPYQILKLLLEHPGEVVSRDELCRCLWPGGTFVDFEHSLNTAIRRLREALSDSPENPIFIETLQRRGYRFIAPVTQVTVPQEDKALVADQAPPPTSDLTRAMVTTADPATTPSTPARYPATLPGILLLGVLILAVGLLAGAGIGNLGRHRASASGLVMDTPHVPQPVRSLVVLPLDNLTSDVDQEFLADGMTDELIARLSKVKRLRVISRTSSMGYKGTHKSLSAIARELNVDAVVEGTLVRANNHVRITAELVQISSDRALWAETYQSELTDILSLQRRVANDIVSNIQIDVSPKEQAELGASKPIDSEAYEAYLKGRYYWNKRSEDGLTKAIQYFQLAIKREPHYALAYAGLADCYGIIGAAIVGTVPAKDVAPKAEAAAIKAMEIDSNLAEVQTSLATARMNYDWDWTGAENGFRRAIELDSTYATAHQRYSLYLIARGRSDESLAEMKRALWLDPLSVSMNFSLGWRLYMAGQYVAAIRQLRIAVDMDPTFALAHLVLGQAHEQNHDFPAAIAEFQKTLTISPGSPPAQASLAHAYALCDRMPEAHKLLAHLIEESGSSYVSPFYISEVYAGMGDIPNTMMWLQKSFVDRSNALIFLRVDPEFKAMRNNSDFQSILHDLG